MKFKLPSLHNEVSKSNSKSVEDIRQYIYIHNGIAMTFGTPVFIVDLREYIKNECSIEEEDDIDELDKILGFLEGKAIASDAWKELTTQCEVEFEEENEEIIILRASHKMILDLNYNNIGLPYFKKEIVKYMNILKSPTIGTDSKAFKGDILITMGSIFKKEIKSDTVRLFQCEGSASVKYIVNGKPYLIGIINMDEDVNSLNKDLTSEMNISDMVDKISLNLKIDKFEEAVVVEEFSLGENLGEFDDPFSEN